MIDRIRKLIVKYKELLLYGIVGVATTLINIAVFWLCNSVLDIHFAVANVIAWVLSVLFAFFANKIFVFESRDWTRAGVLREAFTFFISRAASLLVDEGLMWLFIPVLGWPELAAKIVSNIVVIIINYFLGKFWVFHKKGDTK